MRKIHPNSYTKSSQNVTGGKISQTVMLKLRKALSGLKTILAQGKVTPKNLTPSKIYRILKLLRELDIIEPGSSYDKVIFLYLANASDGFNFDKAAEIDSKLKTGKGDIIMSTAKELIEKGRQEGWQKGRQEGIQEGWQKGRQQGIQEGRLEERQLVINSMLKKHWMKYKR